MRELRKHSTDPRKKHRPMSVRFFSLKSRKLYEGVDAKHTINFKQPYLNTIGKLLTKVTIEVILLV